MAEEFLVDLYRFEETLWQQGYKRVMGLDEVGRGCLCGPVVAAGVILHPESRLHDEINDSKILSKKQREELAGIIKKSAAFWTIKQCDPIEIDQINILKASIKAMYKCAEAESADPDYLLVDGNRFTDSLTPHQCVVKGDSRSVSIAAASILAKVHRDKVMAKLHEEFPYYGWDSNVGYPTQKHYAGLAKMGYTIHHRRSFKLRTEKALRLPNIVVPSTGLE